MKIIFLILCGMLVANDAQAWVEVEDEDVYVECVGNNCYAESKVQSKKKRPKVTTTYNKDPLAMPKNENNKFNDLMAMPNKRIKNTNDPMAY